MTAATFVEASPALVRGLVGASLVLVVGLLVWSIVRRPRPRVEDADLAPSRGREAALLALILAGALAMRLAGASAGWTPPFYFAQVETLYLGRMIRLGTVWADWWRAFGNPQVVWLHHSPLTLPVAATFQRVLGPSFDLPLQVGTFFGVLEVLLAWAVGRAAFSPAFGLLFAAFVAASPLHLVWSRLGGLYIASLVPVLLVLWLGYQAGRWRSLLLALVAGVAAWGAVYFYFAGRVAMPLGLLGLIVAARHARARWPRVLVLALAWTLALGGTYAALRPAPVTSSFWPRYAGYVGNKGERSLQELWSQNAVPVAQEAQRSLSKYLLHDRTMHEPRNVYFDWDVRRGGLSLAPVALLGLVGVLACLRRPGRGLLWLAMALVGLALPAMSVSTARRFLVLDLGWCALAAAGLLALLRSRLGRALPARAVPWVAAAVPLLVAAWSFASVVALSGILLARQTQPIPFAEAGFGDGITCTRCLEAGRAFERDLADGAFVVAVDNDLERENPTSPGGLQIYGKIAALMAGVPARFVEFYSLMHGYERLPPDPKPYFDLGTGDFGSTLIARLMEATPSRVLWHFERPTQWERWLAGRLVAAGGESTSFETPLSATPGLQVRVPWSARERMFAVVRELAAPGLQEDASCPILKRAGNAHYPFPPLALAGPGGAAAAQAREWLVASWYAARQADNDYSVMLPIGAAIEARDGLPAQFHTLSRTGMYHVFGGGSPSNLSRPIEFSDEQGLGCAARAGGHWWVVDGATGALRTTDPRGDPAPGSHWTGIARGANGELVLASADQWLAVYDPATLAEVRRFPAAVWPSWRVTTGECAPVLAGDGWYATFRNSGSVLSVYDGDGRLVGHRRIDRILNLGNSRISAIGGSGRSVAVGLGYDDNVEILELDIPPACSERPGR